MSDKPIHEMSFEEAMSALEALVTKLESPNVPLEESINLYDFGAKLKTHCEAKLKAAEEKIAQISVSADGKITASPKTFE